MYVVLDLTLCYPKGGLPLKQLALFMHVGFLYLVVWPNGKSLQEISLYAARRVQGNPFVLWMGWLLSSAPSSVQSPFIPCYMARCIESYLVAFWIGWPLISAPLQYSRRLISVTWHDA